MLIRPAIAMGLTSYARSQAAVALDRSWLSDYATEAQSYLRGHGEERRRALDTVVSAFVQALPEPRVESAVLLNSWREDFPKQDLAEASRWILAGGNPQERLAELKRRVELAGSVSAALTAVAPAGAGVEEVSGAVRVGGVQVRRRR